MDSVFFKFLDVFSSVYRKATYFSVLILYPAMLLNVLTRSSSFFAESLGFSINKILSSANSDNYN